MSSTLPQEILDLIVDLLREEPDSLRACCLVSKQWVHRTRKHLFAHVEFPMPYHIKRWVKTFPDPSDSPARYAHSLSIRGAPVVTPVDMGAVDGWIHVFSGIVQLHVNMCGFNSGGKISLVPWRGLSPTLKSLRLTYGPSTLSSEIFGFVCSFPLIEDLALDTSDKHEVDRWNVPSTSPKFTGCLDLKLLGGIRLVVRRLLELPGGLHFSKILAMWFIEDVESMMDLVSKCPDTLESLRIYYWIASAGFLSAFVVGQYLTAICEHSRG